MIFSQQLDRVTEAHAFRAHHPVDHVSAAAARSETVPQIFLRADHQTRRVVFVEGTQTDEVRAVLFQLDPPRFGQTFERDFALEPLDLSSGIRAIDSSFPAVSDLLRKTCQELSEFPRVFLGVREYKPFWYILSKSSP